MIEDFSSKQAWQAASPMLNPDPEASDKWQQQSNTRRESRLPLALITLKWKENAGKFVMVRRGQFGHCLLSILEPFWVEQVVRAPTCYCAKMSVSRRTWVGFWVETTFIRARGKQNCILRHLGQFSCLTQNLIAETEPRVAFAGQCCRWDVFSGWARAASSTESHRAVCEDKAHNTITMTELFS